MTAIAEARVAPPVPGAPGRAALRTTRGFKNDILATLVDGWRRHGDIVRFEGIGPLFPVHLFVHPDYVMHALKDAHDIYPKTPLINDKWRMVVGEGLICSQGELWQRQRRLTQPSFDPHRLKMFDGLIAEETGRMLEAWDGHARSEAVLDMGREMTHLALANLGGAMFSTDWRAAARRMAPAVERAIGHAYHQIESPFTLPERVPTPANVRFVRSRAALRDIMDRMIASRAALPEQPPDLLGALLTARDEQSGEPMGHQQVRAELMTFMFGGHETVAAGMAWTWYLLAKHPEAMRRARAEVDEVLDGRAPTKDDIPRLAYIGRVIKEALRLYPPVSLISRTPVRDDVVGGHLVPQGSMVLISAYVSHRHPDLWENPEGFDPDRWLPERSAGRPKNAWFPFSGGPRQCIGGFFGLIEMSLVIPMVLQRFELDLVPGHPVVPKVGITLGFRHGLRMTVRRRPDAEEGR